MANKRKPTVSLSPEGKEKAEKYIKWIEERLRVPEGKLVGQPITLSAAQREWMYMIYGSPTRMFICSLPRKNGKTSFSAMLVLLHLVGPAYVTNGQIYSAAQSRDQAAILFALAAKMVRMSPDLRSCVTIRDTAKQLLCPELGTTYRALSADAPTAFGLSPCLLIHDEAGQIRGPRSDLFEALETASAAHEAPLSIVISTQAPTDADLLSVLIDDALSGADKRIKCVLYAVAKEADPFDEKILAAAQPNWHLMNHEEVFKMASDAKRMPSRESSFRNLVANQRVTLTSPLFSSSSWEACAGEPNLSGFGDKDVFIGLDLSFVNDLTAAIAVCKDGADWQVQCNFWAPEKGVADRAHKDRVPYDVWANQGFLTLTPGASVDYAFVAQRLCDMCDSMKVKAIAFDRWKIKFLQHELDRMGRTLPLVEWGQGFKDMSPAVTALESAVLNANLRHGGNPILRMCATNAIVKMDEAGNRKLDKSKATGRIDGIVALAMAMGIAASSPQADAEPEYKMFII